MRIGVDARELCGRPTGVGRYLAGLLARWTDSARAREHEFVLYAASPIAISIDTRRFATRTVAGAGGTWWEQVSLPAAAGRDHLDAWFSPAYTVPLRLRVPIVVTIHDISFVAHPEWFRVREGIRRRFLCRRAADRARAILTVSDFSRRELMDRLNVPSEKIRVIPPGVETRRKGPASAGSGTGESSILYVGSIFNRRHVTDLIRAFGPIARARPDVSLDIVGDDRSHPPEDLPRVISREGLETRVRWHRYVSERELDDLYGRARAFALLSEYEGLGLTSLEALASGIPPVLLDTPAARETCGDAAIYVPWNDLAATTRALELALFSDDTRSRLLQAAPTVLAKYQWTQRASETLAVLEESA